MAIDEQPIISFHPETFDDPEQERIHRKAKLAGALRIFKREQFLFLRFEDLMRMKAPALLSVLSNFTGLYTDDQIVRKVREMRECEAGRAKKVPLSFTQKGNASAKAREAREGLANAIPSLEQFFAPYDKMLQQHDD